MMNKKTLLCYLAIIILIILAVFIIVKIGNISSKALLENFRRFEDYNRYDFTIGKIMDCYKDDGLVYIKYKYTIDNVEYTANDVVDSANVTVNDDVLVFYSLDITNKSITNDSITFSTARVVSQIGAFLISFLLIVLLITFIF